MKSPLTENVELIRDLAAQRILVVDGAMGTMIQAKNLTARDFGGLHYEGCNEHLNLTAPHVIREIHESYLEAGADIVETNTFGATRIVLAEYGLEAKTLDINRAAARLAKDAAAHYAAPHAPRFVAGSMGPTTKTILVTGGVSFQQLRDAYAEQAQGLLEGGAGLLILETAQDTLNVKAGLLGIDDAMLITGRRVPVMVSCTIEVMGTMLAGQTIDAFYLSLAQRPLLSIGMNCATGPDFMTDHIRTLAGISKFFVSCIPNAGLPDEHGRYNETPEMFAKKLKRFIEQGWVNIVGGCCGTTPEHIRLVRQMLCGQKPRLPVSQTATAVSGLEAYTIEESQRPVLVGERTNAIGSRAFKELIVQGRWEEGAEIGRRQVRNGAQIIDVCLANPDRDEKADMEAFLPVLVRKIKAPLMIDSTDANVIETALRWSPGKAIINSINLEDGEERFESVAPIIHRYGAAVIVGTIDEDKQQGMAVTRERKLQIAGRSYHLLTKKYGLAPENLIFDLLVFPVGTGDKNYFGSAEETIAAVRLLKKELPDVKTILGISNISFGLPTAGREVLNAVYLHHCVKAGLDLAIVNTEKLARYGTLPEEDRRIAEALLFWKGPGDPAHPQGFDAIAEFSAHFREKATIKTKDGKSHLPVEERLARNVVEGSKEGLIPDLNDLLKKMKPLEIINGPLMRGMDEVGRLFAANEMIVAEVLQSAEVMKAAVAHLEPFMDKTSTASRGKIILATVKGDVHDIGKNLVHIILKNNGYEVIDLGIKVAPETLIEQALKHQPHLIGLSGLLVKSAQQMVVTAQDLKNAGIMVPLLVGGAALSSKFTATRIAPAYAQAVLYSRDAMQGLDLANQLQNPAQREAILLKNRELQQHLADSASAAASGPSAPAPKAQIEILAQAPAPPDLKLHVEQNFDVAAIFRYINPIMLFGKHLGLKGNLERLFAENNPRALEIKKRVEDLQEEILINKYIQARAVYRFFAAQRQGDSILIYDAPPQGNPAGQVLARFDFPRQKAGEGLCLADFVRPAEAGVDFTALFAVTCGAGIMELAARLRETGEYLKSFALQALAIECAEGFAELLHEKIRAMWGIPDPREMTLREKFQAKYRGLRVSFGYPACPNLEDQAKLFSLLAPQEHIGVRLTEGFMMEPEASVSALVLHHPQARYFSV